MTTAARDQIHADSLQRLSMIDAATTTLIRKQAMRLQRFPITAPLGDINRERLRRRQRTLQTYITWGKKLEPTIEENTTVKQVRWTEVLLRVTSNCRPTP